MRKKVTAAAQLHPRLRAWIRKAFRSRLTEAQQLTLPHILAGRSVLLSSPTGSGKTLAGFLGVLDHLIRQHEAGTLTEGIHAIYISPLRALTYDIEKNLRPPLEGTGLADIIRVGMRTGDTSGSDRAKIRRRPPHILLTTPESLAIMLPQKAFAEAFKSCRFVIIDELHALAENKRGSHLTLSLERLESRLAPPSESRTGFQPVPPSAPTSPLIRIGLSATAAPLDLLGRLLTGSRECEVVQATKARGRRVEVLSPVRKEPYPPAGFTAYRVVSDVAAIVQRHRSVIVFCNTRSGTENISMRLKSALPKLADAIEAHHASLDREVRVEVEDRLKHGELRAVVCSTSLELGIDIGSVDCVVMISTPKGISRALQRIGRSGHSIHQESHGILVATNINDLMECVVCAEMTRDARLDPVRIMQKPLDVLAQHLVGLAMEARHTPDACYHLICHAYPFRDLTRQEFDGIQRYLEGGGRSLERQYRQTFGKIALKDGILITPSTKVERDYLANVGVIASEGMVTVWLGRRRLGQVEESFLKRLRIGDIFVLSGRTIRLIEIGIMEIKAEDATGRMPTVPTWNANKMPLTSGLARESAALRAELAARLATDDDPTITDWLVERFVISISNAQAIVKHCRNQLQVSSIPTAHTLLIERFHEVNERDPDADEGLLHFFFHSLIGRSANDALSRIIAHRMKDAVGGNALVTIDDYGFLLTLKPFQDLDLEGWRALFSPTNAAADLHSALRDSSLVQWQFRGVAQTGLMVPRNRPGEERRVKQLQWNAEVLFRVLNQYEPDHPLLEQARREATHTFLDLPRAQAYLDTAQTLDCILNPVPVVAPFSFGIFATKIKEGMMLEDPEEAIERLWRDFEKKTQYSGQSGPTQP